MSLMALLAFAPTILPSNVWAGTCADLWSTSIEDIANLEFRTGRLELRPLDLSDAKELARITSHPSVAPKLGYSIRADVGFYQGYIAKLRHSLKDLKRDKSEADLGIYHDRKLIGSVSVQHQAEFISRDHGMGSRYEIGFLLDPVAQGNGFAREAVERVVRFLFTEGGALEIRAEVFESNKSSQRLLESLGFKVLFRNVDSIGYQLTALKDGNQRIGSLATPRLEIRLLQQSDAQDVHRLLHHPDVARTLGDGPDSVKQVEEYIADTAQTIREMKKDPALTGFAILHKGQFAGAFTIRHLLTKSATGGEESLYNLGYFIDPVLHNQGFATEATKRVVDFLFEEGGAAGIEALVYPGNLASSRVLKKNGFVQIPTLNPKYLKFLKVRSSSPKALQRTENVERLHLFTERLELRPLNLDMVDEIYRMQQEPMVQRIASEKKTALPAIRKHIQDLRTSLKQIRTSTGVIDLAIIRDGKLVGNILAEHTYVKIGSQLQSTYVIGYQIDKAARGQGIASEAVERLVDFLFKEGKADEVQAHVHRGNDASSNVLRKNGFERFEIDKTLDAYVLTLQAWRRRHRDKT